MASSIQMKRFRNQRTQRNYERALKRRRFKSAPRARTMPLNSRTGGLLDKEVKYFDTVKATAQINAVANTWTLMQPSVPIGCKALTVPSQGDGATNRDGKKILLREVHFQGELAVLQNLAGASPYAAGMVRIIIVMDTQTNGTELSVADVVEAGNGALDFRNMAYTKRFKVLMDKNIFLSPSIIGVGNAATYTNNTCVKKFQFHKKFKNPVPIQYNSGTTAIIDNVVDNSIQVMAVSENSAVQFGYTARIRFVG